MCNDDLVGSKFRLAPIDLAHKSTFESAFRSLAQPISDYTFASTYMWGGSLAIYWAMIDSHLCVFANGTGDLTMLMPPLPAPGARASDLGDALGNCFDIMDEYNDRVSDRSHSRVEYVSEELIGQIEAARGRSLVTEPMSGDYVYDTARMIDLAGGGLKSKRHGRSKFLREFPNHRVEALAGGYLPACLDLLDLWCRHGDAAHLGETTDSSVGTDILRHRDLEATRRALETWQPLGMVGMVLLVDEKLVGFTLGEALTPRQCSILIEKTHPDYPGSAQFIFSEFCRRYWSEFPECNVGDDWGIPSLQFTKESYRPIARVAKYQIAWAAAPAMVGYSPAASAASAVRPCAAPAEPVGSEGELIELRDAVVEDVPELVALEQVCFQSEAETFNRRQIRALVGPGTSARVVVACREERIIGWSAGLVRRHKSRRTGRIYNVAVHPDFRGRGIGRRLLRQAVDSFTDDGIQSVYLEVRDDNEVAIRLYRSLGFADHHLLPDYYGPGVHARSMLRSPVVAARAEERMAVGAAV